MRHVRSLGFDDLEARKLLSKVHHPAARAAPAPAPTPAAVATPLDLNGTLVVDMKAASQSTDDQGDQTTMVPVSGVLGTMGKVHGVWSESTDEFGDYLGPDTIEFGTSQGTFTIAFNSSNLGKAKKTPHGSVFPPLGQQFDVGTGAYAKASESGSIQVITNPSKGVAETMTLVTANSVSASTSGS